MFTLVLIIGHLHIAFGGFQSRDECEITFKAGEYRHHIADPQNLQPFDHKCEERK